MIKVTSTWRSACGECALEERCLSWWQKLLEASMSVPSSQKNPAVMMVYYCGLIAMMTRSELNLIGSAHPMHDKSYSQKKSFIRRALGR